jgi:RNA polymerase sigma factor (sigma-70 family)
MRAGQTGSRAPYEAFLVELSASLRRIIAHQFFCLGLNASETEDVVQEVLIAVHSRRSSWDRKRPLLPWLNAITRYKIVDAARRLRRTEARNIHLTDNEWERMFIADETHVHQRPTDIDRLVSLLPQKQQAVIRAVGLEGHSPQQAARHLGMSEGAVRVAFHRSLKRLAAIGGKA